MFSKCTLFVQSQNVVLSSPAPQHTVSHSHQVTPNTGAVLPLKFLWTNPANPGSHQPCHLTEWLSAQWHSKTRPSHFSFIWNVWYAKYIYLSLGLGLFPDRVSHDEWLLGGKKNRSSVSRSINRSWVNTVPRQSQEIFSGTPEVAQWQGELSIAVPAPDFDQGCLLLSPRDANHKIYLGQLQH